MWILWVLSIWLVACFADDSSEGPPLDVVGIGPSYYDTLENNARPFGFQYASSSRYGSDHSITLFRDACILRDGTKDCTAACSDLAQMFGNLETLHNCMSYPRISVHMANNNLTNSSLSLARDLNIEAHNASTLPTRISNNIQRCLLDTCQANSDCNDHLNSTQRSDEDQGPVDFNTTTNEYYPFCAAIPVYLNADVGGVGVQCKIRSKF